jgi:hypothetical protein
MRYDWMYSSHVYSGVAIDSISVCLKLEIGSGVFPDWRVMDFRRRPGSDEPDTQMLEDVPDD